jgi:hypothetical protein
MADYRLSPSFKHTPFRGRPSTPSKLSCPLPIESPAARNVLPQTPRQGRSSLGASPGNLTPKNSPLVYSDGTPVKLYTPKEYAEARRAARRVPSTTGFQGRRLFHDAAESPTQRLVASARESAGRSLALGGCPPDFNANDSASPRRSGRSRSRATPSSSTGSPALGPAPLLDPAATINPGQCERHHTRPTVRLLSVISKCWDDEVEKQVKWTIQNGLLGGRLDERNHEGMWNYLSSAIVAVWPTLRDWIMAYTPDDTDAPWFCYAERLENHFFHWIIDQNLPQKQSSKERVGFSSMC